MPIHCRYGSMERMTRQVYNKTPPSPWTPGPQPLGEVHQKTVSVLVRNLKDSSLNIGLYHFIVKGVGYIKGYWTILVKYNLCKPLTRFTFLISMCSSHRVSAASEDAEQDWSWFSLSLWDPWKLGHQEKVSTAVNWSHVKIQQKEEKEMLNTKHLNLSFKLSLFTTKS